MYFGDDEMKIAFVAVTEAGNLENQSALLFRSIRKYCGRFKDAPIHSFQPRKGPPLKNETLTLFRELGVEHHTEELNKTFTIHPISNKVFMSAYAEKILDVDLIVSLDSDTLFLSEPKSFLLAPDRDVAVRPVDNKIIGSTGPGDPNDAYWRKVYSLCSVPEPPFVRTTVDGKRIRAYFQAGLVVVRRRAGIFRQWQESLEKLIAADHLYPVRHKPNTVMIVDQISLAATLIKHFDRLHFLPMTYNYPLPKRARLAPPFNRIGLEELVHIHYHRWFNKPGFLASLESPLNRNAESYRWMDGFLPFSPIIEGA
jgi:hypothetical protein